jgi:hypothetical protein
VSDRTDSTKDGEARETKQLGYIPVHVHLRIKALLQVRTIQLELAMH